MTLEELNKRFDETLERIHNINCELYRQKIEEMDDEQLKCELTDVITQTFEVEWLWQRKCRSEIISYLLDIYVWESYDALIGGRK